MHISLLRILSLFLSECALSCDRKYKLFFSNGTVRVIHEEAYSIYVNSRDITIFFSISMISSMPKPLSYATDRNIYLLILSKH